jgi:hypothetical protein
MVALSRSPGVEVITQIGEVRLVVELTRPQPEVLQQWLKAELDDLSPDDDRWLTCLHCIGRLAVAIRALRDVAAGRINSCVARSSLPIDGLRPGPYDPRH